MLKSIRDFKKLDGKRVLLRADLNVPIRNGQVVDDFKIIRHLPTIRFLLRHNCKIILLTHLGRPDGIDPNYSVKPIGKRMSELIGKEIRICSHIRGLKAETMAANMKNGEIVFLENARYEKEEEENGRKFARDLSLLAQIYVNDAFAVSHRAHASVAMIRKFLPSYAGLLMEKELHNLNKVLANPKKPVILLIGGAKIKTKAALIKSYMKKADKILIGGALANTFLSAKGYETGKSVIDSGSLDLAKKLKSDNFLLPVDVVVSSKKDGGKTEIKSLSQVGKKDYIFDIGPKTIRLYSGFLKTANTIIWNGPLGMFEIKDFRHGTLALAKVIASVSTGKAFGVVGGGETVEALKITKMQDYVDWVSTGGGAMLSYLGGEKMPGIK